MYTQQALKKLKYKRNKPFPSVCPTASFQPTVLPHHSWSLLNCCWVTAVWVWHR